MNVYSLYTIKWIENNNNNETYARSSESIECVFHMASMQFNETFILRYKFNIVTGT